jgi:hypothetical protein
VAALWNMRQHAYMAQTGSACRRCPRPGYMPCTETTVRQWSNSLTCASGLTAARLRRRCTRWPYATRGLQKAQPRDQPRGPYPHRSGMCRPDTWACSNTLTQTGHPAHLRHQHGTLLEHSWGAAGSRMHTSGEGTHSAAPRWTMQTWRRQCGGRCTRLSTRGSSQRALYLCCLAGWTTSTQPISNGWRLSQNTASR